MRPVSLAIIGWGRHAEHVLNPTLHGSATARVAAIVEPDAARRARAASSHPQATCLSGYQEAVALNGIDAVLIALPNALHAEVALAAFARGKAVYVEKPLALDSVEGARLVEAARAADCRTAIGFNYRFHPLLRRLKAQLAAGRVGRVVAVRSIFTTAARELPSWKLRRATGGGVLLDLGSHHIDLMRFLFDDEVAQVAATLSSRRSEADNALLQLEMRGGVPVQSCFSLTSAEAHGVEVWGEEGVLSVDLYASFDVELRETARSRASRARAIGRQGRAFVSGPHGWRRLVSKGHEPSYRSSLEAFFRCVSRGDAPTPDLHDGLASLKVVEAAERSAAEGRRVNL